MDFGRNIDTPLESIDFTLPGDHIITSQVLNTRGDKSKFDLRIGSSLWGGEEWSGTLFPENTHAKNRLHEYSEKVNYIELNTTFYAVPKRETVISWYEKTKGKDFLFAPKMVRNVTHMRHSRDSVQVMHEFLDVVSELRENLGPVFFQFSDNLGPKFIDLIAETIGELASSETASKCGIFFEIRHPDWFSDVASFSAVIKTLADHNMGLVITDTPSRRDVLHMALTTPKVFVRFNANGEHPVDEARIKDWAARIADWKSKGLTNVYFTIHQTDLTTFPASLERTRNIFVENNLY